MPEKVVTANRLTDGLVVYLDAQDDWSERIADAQVTHNGEDSARLLSLAETPAHAVRIVGPYLIDVEAEEGAPRPVSLREVIRAQGPTARTDLIEPAESQEHAAPAERRAAQVSA